MFYDKATPKIEPLANPEDYHIYSSSENVYEYYRDNFLDDRQKEVYDNFVEASLQFKESFSPNVDNLKEEELEQILVFIVQDHPEIFWLLSYDAYSIFGNVNTNKNIRILYRYTKQEAIEKYEKMKITYQPIIDEASKLNTDREKVRYVRDKIMDIATYDLNADLEVDIDYYCMSSIFEYGKSLCGGYAYGFKFIMDRLNVTSICVVHLEELADNSHIWNMVLLDGAWYNLDISFDDTLKDKYNIDDERYYLVEDNDIFYKDHDINQYLPNL